ncbi:cysteine proteinase 1-like [Spodoptera frugiperda]|uniref:Cysteine proteinase 1-like n=1 Tax=Spodoptera frugiperda TaxID=7108 RepID=A0A9R0EL08_SPOFR|nr:cysteine proteinase 1-like [Spodoptera frugiperda]
MLLSVAAFLLLFAQYNCFLILPRHNYTKDVSYPLRPANVGKVPLYYDWRYNNGVSPVKNQLHCAACWAFSVVANIESHRKIYLKADDILSEQFLIDCDDAQEGCEYGQLLQAFGDIVAVFGGVLRDVDYLEYYDRKGECQWYPSKGDSSISVSHSPRPVPVIGFRRVEPNEEVMAAYLYKYGPLSAAINSESMDRYTYGIDEPTLDNCNPNKLNHAVLIVGYNVYVSETGESTPYWIIKNSWGTEWGDNGYYYLVRGTNACGIASDVSFAFVA